MRLKALPEKIQNALWCAQMGGVNLITHSENELRASTMDASLQNNCNNDDYYGIYRSNNK